MDTDTRKKDKTSGLLSLEASIALTIFIFLMLFMYSFLVVFEARNEIAHTLLTTADSLALDALANETLGNDRTIQGNLYEIYGKVSDDNGLFTETQKWYSGDAAEIQDTVETRFIAFLAGGDRDEADRVLKSLKVVKGIDGLDFSKSHVSENKLFLEVQYQLEYEFQVFGMDRLTFSQSCCSKLWK